ncbi:MAG: anion permease [Candidatus Saccharibacteria bacterium]
MPSEGMILVGLVVLLALAFDYVNGFHDTANAIATSVSTKALSPRMAILVATFFNFCGAMIGESVAKTIGKGIIPSDIATPKVLIAALLSAIAWNLITWYFGIPSSSSHALIGGITGAAIGAVGFGVVEWNGFGKILAGLIISPILGLIVGSIIMTILFWLVRKKSPSKINNGFRTLQIFSAISMATSHGLNDAQKSMGVIAMVLFSAHLIPAFHIPLWVKICCAIAMAFGTMAGGWKIIRTMGGKIFKIEPINGFASDLGASFVIYGASFFGAPVSTTHVVSSSIMGVGAAKRLKGVRWGIAQTIVTAWIVTIPSSGLMAYLISKAITMLS